MQGAVEQVRAVVAEFGLKREDVFGKRSTALSGAKGGVKYKDPVSGATWTGRGKPPRWIAGQERDRFLVA